MTGAQLIIPILLSLIGGTGLGVLFKFFIDRRKLTTEEHAAVAARKRSDFDRALDVVTTQRDDAISLVRECREELELMKMEVQGLRLARDLDPFPNWIIGLDGKYLYVNREFEKQFLEPLGTLLVFRRFASG
jgi:PAS domain-containing protein